MSKVLFVKGTPQSEEQSRSTQVARAFITEYKKVNPTDEIIEVDVYQEVRKLLEHLSLNIRK